MTRKFVGRAIFLRHGQTEYTDVFPDLTEEGKASIKAAGRKISGLVKDTKKVILVSSPRPRALGSAAIIRDTLGNEWCNVIVNPDISSVTIIDKERSQVIFKEYLSSGGKTAVDLSYTHDPRYEDSSVFETRSAVQQRFFRYLTSLAKEMLGKHGELIIVSLYTTGDDKTVHLEVSFRERTRTATLHLGTGTLT
jgi:broad specificity phosphatase PhoE